MESNGRLEIPSVSIENNDIKTLIEILLKNIDENDQSDIEEGLRFQGKTFMEKYSIFSPPEFDKFQDDLDVIEISINLDSKLKAKVTMSRQEVNPLSPFFSVVLIESNSSVIVSGIVDEIRRFFGKRRNLHFIFHTYGIPASIALSFLATYILYFNLRDLNLINARESSTITNVALVISFPIKFILRWIFPYVSFKGSDPLRGYLRFAIATTIIGLIGRFVFILISSGVFSLEAYF